MFTANEARALMSKSVNDIRNTESFKFIIKNLEEMIKTAVNDGHHEVKKNKLALKDHMGAYPDATMCEAIANELRDNGYEYWEYSQLARNGAINPCFGVRW